MRKPVVLTGPGVTREDVIKTFNISPDRQAELDEIVEKVIRRRPKAQGGQDRNSRKKTH